MANGKTHGETKIDKERQKQGERQRETDKIGQKEGTRERKEGET